MKDHEKIRQVIIEKFRAVARERIERLNLALVELEKRPEDGNLVNEVMREVHTLKGEARMVDFQDINLISHRTEDLLHLARSRGFDLSGKVGDLIFSGLDAISLLLNKRAGTEESAVDLEAFVSQVDKVLAEKQNNQTPPTKTYVRKNQSGVTAEKPIIDKKGVESIRTGPPDEHLLRINIEKLDHLSDLVGDMLLNRVRLRNVLKALDVITSANQKGKGLVDHEQLTHASQALTSMKEVALAYDRQVENLEVQVRNLRLVALATLFRTYLRLVRDLAKEQQKLAEITTIGANIELDKQVLDQLADPILHILRNAVDHGIERPEVRRLAGKKESGAITLKARQLGGKIEIEIADDGAGIDQDDVLAKAKERGIVPEKQSGTLSESECIELLFIPGFSTRREVSDLSGRGIGLDVVKKKIEAIGGSVRIESTLGQGTRFIFTVPMTVAISQALLVEAGGSKYAIPSFSIERIEQINLANLTPVGTGMGVRLRDEVIPFAELGDILKVTSETPQAGKVPVPVVVVKQDDRSLALRVDRTLGECEIMQKPLDPFLSNLRLFSGTTTLSEGDLALVITPAELIRAAASRKTAGSPAMDKPAPEARGPETILVVEDSEITRDLVVEIVRSPGYRVVEAANGQEALIKLREVGADLVLTDLEMPVMDGFEFLSKVREDPATHDIPVVVLTTRGSEEDKRRALALGADSYIVKSEFHEHLLLDIVRRFLRH